MKCCSGGDPAASAIAAPSLEVAPTSWLRKFARLIQWAVPVTTLALLPKCPGCVAGYVLLLTGVGVSFTTATAMRWTVIGLSIAALTYLMLRTARRLLVALA